MARFFGWVAERINKAIFWIAWLFGRILFRLYFRLSIENAPRLRGAYVIAANHSSLLDGALVQFALRRHVFFFLTIGFYRLRALHWFFRWIHTIPVYEGGGNKNALSEASERLRQGEVVGIFPEGGIAADGKFQAPRPGVSILSESAQVSVIPVAILGAFEAMPRGSYFPKPRKITLRFGEPIPALPRTDAPRRERYREYAETVMSRISALMSGKSE